MRSFLHIITDLERLPDPDGGDFGDLEEAVREAEQSARDLMADELRAGRPLPLGWRVQIVDEDGAVRATVKFADLLGSAARPNGSAPIFDPDLVERAKATFMRARRGHDALQETLRRLRQNVRALSALNEGIGGWTRN